MLTREQIKARLNDANLKAVAASSKVPYHTLYKFMRGTTEPKYSTVKMLSDYLKGLDNQEC